MPGMQCRSGPSPVAMSEQATGVTDGKADTQSPISVPRSSSSAKLGARPSAVARSSMSVRSESTTIRQSLRDTGIGSESDDGGGVASPQHPQALVLALGTAAAGGAEPDNGKQGEQGDRLHEQRQGGQDQGAQRDDQPDRRGAVVACLSAGDHPVDDPEREHGDQGAHGPSGPGGVVGGSQGGAEQDRASDCGRSGEQEADGPTAPGGAAEGAGGKRQPDPLAGG